MSSSPWNNRSKPVRKKSINIDQRLWWPLPSNMSSSCTPSVTFYEDDMLLFLQRSFSGGTICTIKRPVVPTRLRSYTVHHLRISNRAGQPCQLSAHRNFNSFVISWWTQTPRIKYTIQLCWVCRNRESIKGTVAPVWVWLTALRLTEHKKICRGVSWKYWRKQNAWFVGRQSEQCAWQVFLFHINLDTFGENGLKVSQTFFVLLL
jgi:hypothetical protein